MKSNLSYKDAIKKVLELRSKSASHLYDRVKLLVYVFNDSDFRADLGNVDDHKAADALNQYVDDTPLMFLQLRAMLIAAPDRQAWMTRPLRDILADAMAKAAPEEKKAITRNRVTRADFEDMQVKLQAMSARNQHLEEVLAQRTRSYQELLEEIRRLEQELAVAKGRIIELEKMAAHREAA